MKNTGSAVMAVVGVSVVAGWAVSARGQAPAAGAAILFEAARVIVGDGRPPIENAAFVVSGGRFTQVGRTGDIKAPAGAVVVNLAGKTVMPAIIDTHTHLSQTREALINDLRRRPYYGVSAAMSLGQDEGDLPFQMRAESSTMPGTARFFTAGRGITAPEPGRTMVPYWVATPAEARKAVQELAAKKVDIVKIWIDDRMGQYKKLTPDLYGAVIDEAHKNKLRATAHIFALEDAKGALRADLDAFAHIPARDKDVDEEFMGLIKQHRNIVLVPNLPDRGVTADLSWLKGSLPAAELQKLAGRQHRSAAGAGRLRDPGAQPGEDERGGRAHRARHRRQHAVGAARRDGGYGGGGDDAGPGDRRRDAQRRGVPETDRRGHGRRGQERGFHRPRRQSAGRHHEHAPHLVRLSSRRRGGPCRDTGWAVTSRPGSKDDTAVPPLGPAGPSRSPSATPGACAAVGQVSLSRFDG